MHATSKISGGTLRLLHDFRMAPSRRRRCLEDSDELESDGERPVFAPGQRTRFHETLEKSRQQWLKTGKPLGRQTDQPPSRLVSAPVTDAAGALPSRRPVATKSGVCMTALAPLFQDDSVLSHGQADSEEERHQSRDRIASSCAAETNRIQPDQEEGPIHIKGGSGPTGGLQQQQEFPIEHSLCAIMEEDDRAVSTSRLGLDHRVQCTDTPGNGASLGAPQHTSPWQAGVPRPKLDVAQMPAEFSSSVPVQPQHQPSPPVGIEIGFKASTETEHPMGTTGTTGTLGELQNVDQMRQTCHGPDSQDYATAAASPAETCKTLETAAVHSDARRTQTSLDDGSSQALASGLASRLGVSTGTVAPEASTRRQPKEAILEVSSPRMSGLPGGHVKPSCSPSSPSQFYSATRSAEEELKKRRRQAALQLLRMGTSRKRRPPLQLGHPPAVVVQQSAGLPSPEPRGHGQSEAPCIAPATPPPTTRGGPAVSPSPVRSGLLSSLNSGRLLKRRKSTDDSSEATSAPSEESRSCERSNYLRGLPRPELVELAGQLERRYS